MGAPLSSIGSSVPSLRIRSVWFASPTAIPESRTFSTGIVDRLAGRFVDDVEKPFRTDCPIASAAVQPVRFERHLVHERDFPGGIGNDHAIADARQRDGRELLLTRQVFRCGLSPADFAADSVICPYQEQEVDQCRSGERAGANIGGDLRGLPKLDLILFLLQNQFDGSGRELNPSYLCRCRTLRPPTAALKATGALLQLDRVVEFRQFLISQPPKFIHIVSREQSVGGARVKISQFSRDHADGLVVWSEIILVSREQISPLAGLRILIAGQEFVQRIDRLMDAGDFAVVAA